LTERGRRHAAGIPASLLRSNTAAGVLVGLGSPFPFAPFGPFLGP